VTEELKMVGKSSLKVGDVVRLKSGGAEMTVVGKPTNLGAVENVQCSWHAGKKHESHMYPVEALELVPPKEEK